MPQSYQNTYSSFGSYLAGTDRKDSETGYQYGFNGKRKDDEMHNQSGSSYDFDARLYNSRLGRWMVKDRFEHKYVEMSPYSFALNNPVLNIDKSGNKVTGYDASDLTTFHDIFLKALGSNDVLKGLFVLSEDGMSYKDIDPILFNQVMATVENKDVKAMAQGMFQNINSKEEFRVNIVDDDDDIKYAGVGGVNVGADIGPTEAMDKNVGGFITETHEAVANRTYTIDRIEIIINPSQAAKESELVYNSNKESNFDPDASVLSIVPLALFKSKDPYLSTTDFISNKVNIGVIKMQLYNSAARLLNKTELSGEIHFTKVVSEQTKKGYPHEYDVIEPPDELLPRAKSSRALKGQ